MNSYAAKPVSSKIMNIYVFFILTIFEFCWSLPTSKEQNGQFIDSGQLVNLIQESNKNLKIIDFQSTQSRETFGYIKGSFLVPDSLKLENIEKDLQSLPSELLYDKSNFQADKEDEDVVVFVTTRENKNSSLHKLKALGYDNSKLTIKGYVEGLDMLSKTSGLVEFPRIISFSSLNASLASDSILLIDVRNRTELNSVGQIPNSVCIPLHEIINGAFFSTNGDFMQHYGFKKPLLSDSFVLSCRSGQRILVAEKYLIKEIGYKHVRIYPGSFNDWVANGGRVIEGNFEVDYDGF